MQVKLPDGMLCTNCVLQVEQFMSNHGKNNPGGCFYHHCAIVNITADGPQDAGVAMGGDDAGTTPPSSSGGGVRTSGDGAGFGRLLLVAAVAVGMARRRPLRR